MDKATAPEKRGPTPNVGMAQIHPVARPEQAASILGSCIGLVLYAPESDHAIMGHIVLPHRRNSDGPAGKFADSAVPEMLRQLRMRCGTRSVIRAKMAGGASMFNAGGPLQIGVENAKSVKELLSTLDIPLVAEHVGGTKGRRVVYDSTSCSLFVTVSGQHTEQI